MALGCLILFWMILCAAALVRLLLWAAWRSWRRGQWLLTLLFRPPAGLCLWVGCWLLGVLLREPFWRFYF